MLHDGRTELQQARTVLHDEDAGRARAHEAAAQRVRAAVVFLKAQQLGAVQRRPGRARQQLAARRVALVRVRHLRRHDAALDAHVVAQLEAVKDQQQAARRHARRQRQRRDRLLQQPSAGVRRAGAGVHDHRQRLRQERRGRSWRGSWVNCCRTTVRGSRLWRSWWLHADAAARVRSGANGDERSGPGGKSLPTGP